MPQITQTQLVSAALAHGGAAPMTTAEIVGEEIARFLASPKRREMERARAYYANRSAVQDKPDNLPGRSNARIEHPIYRKLVDQKVRYLLARPWSVQCANPDYAGHLNALFDRPFRRMLQTLGRWCVGCGVAWMQPYIDGEGQLRFLPVPPWQLIPLWADGEHTRLDGFIRFYDQEVYRGRVPGRITRAELWSGEGVERFLCADGSGRFVPEGERAPHFTLDGRGYNFRKIPLVWLRYNPEELPLLRFVGDLIDDYNWQTSVTADALRDVAKFVFVLRNYGGADLGEFMEDLRRSLAVKVDGDGGVDKLQADLDVTGALAFLDKQRRDLFEFASAVDVRDPDLGTASGTALHFRYMDLDADCADLADELRDAFARLKPFADTWLAARGAGDFAGEAFTLCFNTDMPVNEGEVIQNLNASRELLSRRTLLANHPWVEDVDKELELLEAEGK